MTFIQRKIQRFFILGLLCTAQFICVPALAETAATTEPLPQTVKAGTAETGTTLVAAGKRRRRRQPRRRAPGKRRRGGRRNGNGKGGVRRGAVKQLAKSAVKGNVGIVSGLEGIDDPVFTFGGDYIMPMGSNLNIQIGLSYWFHDIVSDLFATRISVLTPGVGAGYMIRVGPKMWVEASGKLVFATFAAETTIDDGAGNLSDASTSDSSAGLSLGGGFHYDIGGMAIGPEVQYPIYFDEKLKDASAINILFFLEFQL